MNLLTARDLKKTFGPQEVLGGVSLGIDDGDRIGLVGVNGSGKSTLARILAGLETADTGNVARRRDAEIAYLAQEPVYDGAATAREVVLGGLTAWSAAMAAHDAASARIAAGETGDAALKLQADAATAVERAGGFEVMHRVEEVLEHLDLRAKIDATFATLSGGERRRVALARILVARPALAILDEPTNHLDVETIAWLERYLRDEHQGGLLLITHDRYVLDRVCTRTWEVDRGKLYAYEGGYAKYLAAKAERVEHEERTEQNRRNFLRKELDWLSRPPPARTRKQGARIERALAAKEVPRRRELGAVSLSLETTRTGKTILECKDLVLRTPDGARTLLSALDLTLVKGDRIGIVGPNGAGKTTLLRTLLGELPAAGGEVVRGKSTTVAYFDQTRSGLEESASILENVTGGRTRVTVAGQTMDSRSWLERFLFDPGKQRQPVSALSGGERARVVLAKLLLSPANLLVLDEPTNDLDTATLSSLEALLVEMDATALIVTHDRYFLDRVATSILAFEGDARAVRYEGNYETYVALREEAAELRAEEEAERARPAAKREAGREPPREPKKKGKGLTYGERLELEKLPEAIEAADAEVRALEANLADPASYTSATVDVPALVRKLDHARAESARRMARWEELETKKESETE